MLTAEELKLLKKNDKVRVNYKFNNPNHSSYVKRMVSNGIMSSRVAPSEKSYEGSIISNNDSKLRISLDDGSNMVIVHDDVHDSGSIGVDSTFHIEITEI